MAREVSNYAGIAVRRIARARQKENKLCLRGGGGIGAAIRCAEDVAIGAISIAGFSSRALTGRLAEPTHAWICVRCHNRATTAQVGMARDSSESQKRRERLPAHAVDQAERPCACRTLSGD